MDKIETTEKHKGFLTFEEAEKLFKESVEKKEGLPPFALLYLMRKQQLAEKEKKGETRDPLFIAAQDEVSSIIMFLENSHNSDPVEKENMLERFEGWSTCKDTIKNEIAKDKKDFGLDIYNYIEAKRYDAESKGDINLSESLRKTSEEVKVNLSFTPYGS